MNVILFQHIDQLWKSRCDKYTFFILDTFDSLVKHFLNDCCKIGSRLSFRYLVQIHKYSNKWSLSIRCHQCDDLILDHLHTTVDFFFYTQLCYFVDFFFVKIQSDCLEFPAHLYTEFFTADLYKWCKM